MTQDGGGGGVGLKMTPFFSRGFWGKFQAIDFKKLDLKVN